MDKSFFIQRHYNINYRLSFLLLIILCFILPLIVLEENNRILDNYYQKIHLVIQGNRSQNFISNEFQIEPSEVIINGKTQSDTCKKNCDFENEINNVTLVFTVEIKSCVNMFKDLITITEIDLSDFDFSRVMNMSSMFHNCSNLQKINFGKIDTSSVQDMSSLFYYCSKLTSLNLSNFDTSSVTNMERMFVECSSLQELNVSNFKTSKVVSMRSMFNRCKSIISINISNFDTSKVRSMALIFYNCPKLTKITFEKLNTSSVEDMQKMFYLCKTITTIDISKFDTSKVTNIAYMFYNCTKLKTLKLGKMNTSSVVDMQSLFYHCETLQSADLTNFDTSLVTHMGWMFFHCYEIKEIKFSKSFNTSNVISMFSMFSNCRILSSIDVSNFDTTKVTEMCYMFHDCKKLKFLNLSNFSPINLTNIQQIFEGCTSLLYLNIPSFHINNNTIIEKAFNKVTSKRCIEDENTKNSLLGLKKVSICSDTCFNETNKKVYLKEDKCIKSCQEVECDFEYDNTCYHECPNNTYVRIDKPSECFDPTPSGFYLDLNQSMFKKCFSNCSECFGAGNELFHNCSKCKTNFIFINESKYSTNCFKKCNHYYYFNELSEYLCTENKTCPEQYKILITEKNKCIDECRNDDIYSYYYNNTCLKKCPIGTISNDSSHICKEYDISNEDRRMLTFQEEAVSGDIIDNVTKTKKDYIRNEKDITYQVTTTENQNNNNYSNISTINFGTCENILRDKYKIDDSLPLIIIKIDYKPPDILIPIVGYEIYHPITKEKLNLTWCSEILIKLNIPVSIEDNDLFKHDPNSRFYSDNCFPYTTQNGTDIILSDRRQEYKENNLSLCEKNCVYKGYDKEKNQSSCECAVKNKMELISEIFENPDKLSDFPNNETISGSGSTNIITIKCTKELFSKEGLKSNISSYILFIFIFDFLLSIVLFMKCGYKLLENDISEIISEKERQIKKVEKQKTNGVNKKTKKKIKKKIAQNFPPKKNRVLNVRKSLSINNFSNFNKNNNTELIKDGFGKMISTTIDNNQKKKKKKKKENNIMNKNNKANNNMKNIDPMKCNDYELNTFSYENFISFDKRTCIEYYISLIKTKHPLIFAVCPIILLL